MTEITGKYLTNAGANPGKWFKAAIECANRLIAEGSPVEEVIPAVIAEFQPAPHLPLRSVVPMFQMNIRAENPHEAANVTAVFGPMEELMRTRAEERRGGKGCVSTCRSRWSPYH